MTDEKSAAVNEVVNGASPVGRESADTVTATPAPAVVEADAATQSPRPPVLGGGQGGPASGQPGAGGGPPQAGPTAKAKRVVPSIAGVPALKGLILYGAVLTFAGLYAYFIARILAAAPGKPPDLDAAMVSAAAALAGVLGSAFALEVGTPRDESKTNPDLATALDEAQTNTDRVTARIRQILSLESSSTETASWPKTFGIWVYAVVAAAVAVTYVLNQSETPATIKALAVAFGGYVIALITNAYNLSKQPANE